MSVDEKLSQRSNGGGALYFVADHLSSTRALMDSAGNVVEQVSYDSFGDSAGSALTRYGYTGRERDADTGLYYYRARWYDPQQGRFISEDPIGLAGGINLYGYVANNPLRFTDPSGLCPNNLGAAPEDDHNKDCKSLERAIRSHAKQAQRHLNNYGDDFDFWIAPGPPFNHLTGQLRDYQNHVDEVRKLTEQYEKDCNDIGPPPPVPAFKDLPNNLKDMASGRRRGMTFRDLYNRLKDIIGSPPRDLKPVPLPLPIPVPVIP